MKLLMATSADGYLAKGPNDDMRWTPAVDKKLFKLLTLSSDQPLLAGRVTAEQLPLLPDRAVVALSRTGLTLQQAAIHYHPGSWLIGGPTIAYEALVLGLITQVVLCRNQHELGGGISIDRIASRLMVAPRHAIKFEDVDVLFFTPIPGDK